MSILPPASESESRAAVYPKQGRRLLSDLEKRQQKHERNAERAQKEIEAVLKKRKLSLVANYVKETNMVHLELIPVELMQARAVAQAAGEEYKKTLTEQGDAITAKE